MGDPASPRPAMPLTVWVVAVVGFFVSLGYGVIVPVLPVLATSFGVGAFEVGLVISVFAVSRVMLTPFVPRMMSRFGDRLVIGVGLYVTAITYVFMGLADNVWQLIVLRFVAGAGSVMFTIAAMNLLMGAAPADRRARAMGLLQGGFVLGIMAGPALGGVLALVSVTTPFLFYAVSVGVAATVGLVFLPRGATNSADDPATADAPDAPSLSRVARDPGFQAALVTNFANGWATFGVRTALVPVIVTAVLHHDPVWTGIAIAVGVTVQSIVLLPVTRFVDTAGRRPGILLGGLLCAVSTLGLALAPNLIVLTLALMVMGVGAAFTGSAPPAAVADAAGKRTSRPIAVFSLMQDLGQIIGPVVAGLLWDHTSPVLAFGVGAALLLVAAATSLRMPAGRP